MNKQTRQLAAVISGQNTSDGAGVKLKRIVSQQQKNVFDPFILLDEFGSDEPTDYVGGFPDHPHRGFETVTYMLAGAMMHRDSLGTGSVIRPGDVQRMSAGTGVTHSEFNHSKSEPVHLLQIWILPERRGLKPGYEQKSFSEKELAGGFRLVAAPNGYGAAEVNGDALTIHQDVSLYAAKLTAGQKASHALAPGRHAWVQVARGAVQMNGQKLAAGDGAAISDEKKLEFVAEKPAEILLFDLA